MTNNDVIADNTVLAGDGCKSPRTFVFFGGYFEVPEGEDAQAFRHRVMGEFNPEVDGHTPKLEIFDAITDLDRFCEELRAALRLDLPK